MNQRISVLLDRDHAIGHAYFMSLIDDPRLESLTAIFRNNVLPLLQEYFFEDWQHIRWVLNDHRKADDYQIVQECTADLDQLFGVDIGARQDALEYRINADALERAEAYWGIGGDGGDNPNQAGRVRREVEHSGRIIRQLTSGTIEVLKDGQLQKNAKSHLREVAGALGISVNNDSGTPHNTRQLGKTVIDAIAGQQ
jgi:5-methylcytosine-specific restriction protein B